MQGPDVATNAHTENTQALRSNKFNSDWKFQSWLETFRDGSLVVGQG